MSDQVDYRSRGPEFSLQEFIALRSEILALLETLRTLERNMVIAVGVSWGWLFEKGDRVPQWAWLIPVLFPLLGGARVIMKHFGEFRDYIKSIENAFLDNTPPIGWQNATTPKGKSGTHGSDGTRLFWWLLFLATIVVGIWGYYTPHPPPVK